MDVAVQGESPWRASRYRKFDAAVKREAVLREAARTFNEKGFHATSLDHIALRLQVTKPTLYYYFHSKEDILYECLMKGLGELERTADRAQAMAGSGRDKLIAVMRDYAGIVLGDFGLCIVRVGQDPLGPRLRAQARRVESRAAHKLQRLIAEGISDGSIAPCDPKIMASTFAGALNWITRWYRPDGALSAEAITQQCIDMLLNGFAPRKGEAAGVMPRRRGAKKS